MSSRQISDAHQKLAYNFTAGKAKRFTKELDPLLLRLRMVGCQPAIERSVRGPQLQDLLRIGDGGIDLQPIADDAGVGQQSPPVSCAIRRDDLGVEPAVRAPECLALLEDGEPGETRLIDFQHEPLEQGGILLEREAILPIVIRPVPFMSRRKVTVCSRVHGC